MAFQRTISSVSRLCYRSSWATLGKRGYADASGEMAFTFATPSECFYSNAKVKQVKLIRVIRFVVVVIPSPLGLHSQFKLL